MKKILAIALAIVLLFGCFPAYAYNIPKVKNVTKAEDKIEALKQKDIIIGYEDGSLGLERYIKRSELTKVLVHAVGEEKVAEALKGKMDLFTDVARTHWANGYIAYAKNYPNPINKLPFVNGYPDGSFRPENNITNAEMLKILVVLAKRDLTENMVKNAKWPSDWVEWAKNEKIIGKDVGLDDLALNEPAIREDSFVALYNSFVQLEKTGPLKEETKKEPVKITPSKKPSSGTGGHVKPTPTPTPTPTPKPPAKDPNKALKDAVSNFIDTIDLETIEKVADPKGKAIYNIPPKAEGLKTLKDNIKRAKELIGKKRLTDDEVKELEALKPVKHEKKDKLINGLANDISHGFVVNWEVQGPRTVKNKDDSRHYTELTDDQIIVKSNAVELKDGTYKAYINYVTKDQYTAGGTIDTVSGATPKYKKQELDSKFYTVEKTADGFIFKMNVNEPGYQELMKNTSILKPIIKVPVADRVKIENGDLVFVKEQVPTPGTTDATENPAVAPTDKTKVVDIKNITEEEKTEAKNAIVAENPKATEVVINADGSATLKYADGSENTLAKDEIFEAAPVV
ncbi:MAG: S-layer homology domain-containing protein, partial [Tissierellia bacterium]|nr:S-layer homology domain-containing protein [Tissierellia bacterium]